MKPLEQQGECEKRWTRADLGYEPPAPEVIDFMVALGTLLEREVLFLRTKRLLGPMSSPTTLVVTNGQTVSLSWSFFGEGLVIEYRWASGDLTCCRLGQPPPPRRLLRPHEVAPEVVAFFDDLLPKPTELDQARARAALRKRGSKR